MKNKLFLFLSFFLLISSFTRANDSTNSEDEIELDELEYADDEDENLGMGLEISENTNPTPPERGATEEGIFSEMVKKISPSKLIALLTNNNNLLAPGDYFTVLLEDEKAFRALCIKKENKVVAFKILHYYREDLSKKLTFNQIVKIIRGDDTFYKKEKTPSDKKEKTADSIEQELLRKKLITSDTLLEDDFFLENGEIKENQNRYIKTDNILGSSMSSHEGYSAKGGKENFTAFDLYASYQFYDNLWLEAFYAFVMLKKFPAEDLNSSQNSYGLRLKYTFELPLNLYAMPYLGYTINSITAPGAGTTEEGEPAEGEKKLIEESKKSYPHIGLSVLHRLVPGWFARADLQMDTDSKKRLSLGINVEF